MNVNVCINVSCSVYHTRHIFIEICLLSFACVFIWICGDVWAWVCFSLTRSSHILSPLWHSAWPQTEHPVALQSLLTFDLCAVAPQSDSLCWISVWKRLSVLAGLEGLQITKNTKQTKYFASAPFDWRSPLSPEDLLRKPNPALVLFLLFADFRGFGLRRRIALEQRFL